MSNSEALAQRIRDILGPYNDDTESLQNLISILVLKLDEALSQQEFIDKETALAAIKAGYHITDDMPLATRSFIAGFKAGRGEYQREAEPVSLQFPTMLRKMWSGGEVQTWIDEQGTLYARPLSQGKVPDAIKMQPFQTIDKSSKNYAAGWNACRLAMLSTTKEQTRSQLPKGITRVRNVVTGKTQDITAPKEKQ